VVDHEFVNMMSCSVQTGKLNHRAVMIFHCHDWESEVLVHILAMAGHEPILDELEETQGNGLDDAYESFTLYPTLHFPLPTQHPTTLARILLYILHLFRTQTFPFSTPGPLSLHTHAHAHNHVYGYLRHSDIIASSPLGQKCAIWNSWDIFLLGQGGVGFFDDERVFFSWSGGGSFDEGMREYEGEGRG